MKPVFDNRAKRARWEQAPKLPDKNKQNIAKLLKIGAKIPPASANPPLLTSPAEAGSLEAPPPPPQTVLKSGDSGLKYYSRADETIELHTQPWANELVSTLLAASARGGVHLCLVWPVKLDSLALLHGLANLERNFDGDLKGLRTLLFPGLSTWCTVLQSVVVNRVQLSDKYRSLWKVEDGEHKFQCKRKSASFEAVLAALNDIRIWQPELPNPSLGELVPPFSYDAKQREWTAVAQSPLERSLRKVTNRAHKKTLRSKVNSEWGLAKKAPGALMVLHPNARKDVWKMALSSSQLNEGASPDVFLLDATSTTERRYYNAVKKIPEFLRYAKDNGFSRSGAVVVTDDPKTFFLLRSRLDGLQLLPETHVWAAEADQPILSAVPLAQGWKPEQKSNANFTTTIVDRDASSVALRFQRLAHTVAEDSPAHDALMAACMYVLWLSNMPVGYKDLGEDFTATGGETFSNQQSAWNPHVFKIKAALLSGTLNDHRTEVEHALDKANDLIDRWSDATPMALKLLSEVKKHTCHLHGGLSIVLPSQKSIRLAHRFLGRKLGQDWSEIQQRLNWHTLASIGATLDVGRDGWGIVFVGINSSVLRLLLAHPNIPHGTAILVAYRQALSTVVTLKAMLSIDAFKVYHGRIGLLAQELERRLQDVPNPLNIERLSETLFNFSIADVGGSSTATQQTYYKFDLESGERAYSSGWIYRYSPDDDPCFLRANASGIAVGDLIFVMSDELKGRIELLLGFDSVAVNSRVNPARVLLKLYHDDVQTRCELFFTATSRAALAREIHAKMEKLDPAAADCKPERIQYWLALDEGDNRPHASKDSQFFKIFCRALQIDDSSADQHWMFIRNARAASQHLGRELAFRYSEVIFATESAMIYRKVPLETIQQLQQEALRCVDRVVGITAPTATAP